MKPTTYHYFKILLFSLLLSLGTSSCSKDNDSMPKTSFETVITVSGERLWQATGMEIDNASNSCFIVTRETDPGSGQSTERITKIDLVNKTGITTYSDVQDFISKNVHVLNNELAIIGGTIVTYYNSANLELLQSFNHGLELSRFGSDLHNNTLFIWGGDLNEVNSDKIYQLNQSTNLFEVYGQLSEPRTWAHGEIINNTLYVFGGQEEFENTPIKNTILIYDLNTQTETKIMLPYSFFRTFTAKLGSTIYVAGHVVNGENTTTILGKYDTETNAFTEIDFELPNGGNIHQLAVDNEYLYALAGEEELFADFQVTKMPLP